MIRSATVQRGPSTRNLPHNNRPRETVLPLAFWDAALELEAEDDMERMPLPADSHDAFDSARLSDTEGLGAQWLARATRSDDMQSLEDVDDPAEIPADSASMISEASRSAASVHDDDDVQSANASV